MKDEKCKNLIILFLGLIFVYSCLRSCFLSITHDEAITVLYHSQHSFWDIVYYNTPILSNNHLLNTLLVKLSIALFGFNELAVRVPALLGHLLYLTGIYQLIKFVYRKSDVFFGIPIIFLVANPFVLDFFSL
ncbi:MAG: hypothetical protein NT091_04220, partial [Candidatus Falkowbacteria bacterium]|nr:hypothetical protein [Candidatus Falkowbacteria bacterium]